MLVTQSVYAKMRGVSQPYISTLVKKGVLVVVDGKIDSDVADLTMEAMRVKPYKRRSGGTPPAPASPTEIRKELSERLFEAKVSSEISRANILKIKEKITSGQYVNIDEIKKQASRSGRLLRDRILCVPDRIASALSVESDPAVIRDILSLELRGALEALPYSEE